MAAKAENKAVIRAVPLAKKYWEYTKVAEIIKDVNVPVEFRGHESSDDEDE